MKLQKLKSEQFGIAHLGLILIVIVLFAVGGASYLVYQRQSDKNDETAVQVDADEEEAQDGEDDEANESAQLEEENEAAAEQQ